jgi:DNA-binding LacI/PurR family transcriptional regulator
VSISATHSTSRRPCPSSIADVCADRGYGVTLVPITGAADDVGRVTEAAVDGFIVWTTSDDDPVLTAVQSTKRPAVIHGGPALPGLQLVSIDNRAAARAIGAIAFPGASRPAIVSQPLSRDRISTITRGADITHVPFPVTRHRLAGYRDAAEAAGFDWRKVTVAVCARNDEVEAEQMTARLLAAVEPPDTILAMSDQQAAGVVRTLHTAGRTIPDEVAVTGWDDAPVAERLGLTTVASPCGTRVRHALVPPSDRTPALSPDPGRSSAGQAHETWPADTAPTASPSWNVPTRSGCGRWKRRKSNDPLKWHEALGGSGVTQTPRIE